jgi:hypothetical protein
VSLMLLADLAMMLLADLAIRFFCEAGAQP